MPEDDKYFARMEEIFREVQEPLNEGDTISSAIQDRLTKLSKTDIEEDPEILKYAAYSTLQDMIEKRLSADFVKEKQNLQKVEEELKRKS